MKLAEGWMFGNWRSFLLFLLMRVISRWPFAPIVHDFYNFLPCREEFVNRRPLKTGARIFCPVVLSCLNPVGMLFFIEIRSHPVFQVGK
jgi:hypothetical protein